MTLYVESSAVLAWLLGEPAGEQVRQALATSELIVSSDLTLVECDRVLIRAQALGYLSEAGGADLLVRLNRAAAHWNLLRIDSEVVERARRPFPGEPIRTLDALHLASALVARAAVEGLVMLSLDRRVRAVGKRLGLNVLPA